MDGAVGTVRKKFMSRGAMRLTDSGRDLMRGRSGPGRRGFSLYPRRSGVVHLGSRHEVAKKDNTLPK